MTELKLYYAKLNPKQKNDFREQVMNNEAEVKVGLSSFFNYLENQHAPAPLQKVLSKLTGIPKEDLYKSV